jgi:hypothetical protein
MPPHSFSLNAQRKMMDWSDVKENLRKDIDKLFDDANKMWFNVLRLIITLSSSSLLITLALLDKLFPDIKTFTDISNYLVISWVLFLLSVVLALIAKANEIIFYGNVGRYKANRLGELNRIISEGGNPETLGPEKNYINNTIYWGVLAFDSFLIGISTLCLAFLEKIVDPAILNRIFLVVIISVVFLNLHMIKKRET